MKALMPQAIDNSADLASIDAAITEQNLTAVADKAEAAGGTPPVHDYEYEARRKGWKPEGEYTGPEGKWVDSKTFVERGERFTKKLETEIESLKGKIASFEGTKTQFRKFFDDQMAKRDQEHAAAIATLRTQRSAAQREGDDALVVELEDRIEATQEQRKTLKAEGQEAAAERTAEAAPAAQADNPVLDEWVADGNSWFKTDEVLTKHAIAVGQQFRKDGDKTMGRAFLEKVAEQVRSDFPRRFKAASDAPGTRQSATEGSAQGGTGTGKQAGYNGKTERDLPPADLAIMRQFVQEGLYTKEQFLKSYFSRNG